MKEPQPDEQASFNCTVVYSLILDFDTFHVLTADIKDTVYFRIKECSSVIMCYSLYFAIIQHEVRL